MRFVYLILIAFASTITSNIFNNSTVEELSRRTPEVIESKLNYFLSKISNLGKTTKGE